MLRLVLLVDCLVLGLGLGLAGYVLDLVLGLEGHVLGCGLGLVSVVLVNNNAGVCPV